ncbi:hypothetical protein ScPMuIL_015869 [Solemya velum]
MAVSIAFSGNGILHPIQRHNNTYVQCSKYNSIVLVTDTDVTNIVRSFNRILITDMRINLMNDIRLCAWTQRAIKTCLPNGSWLSRNGTEWSDYTHCLNYEKLKVTIFLSLACNLASLAFLIPSVFIFSRYRSLRKQQRIQLHINFFLSFILSGVVVVFWDMLVTYERLTSEIVTDTLLYKNTAGCKALSFLKIYFKGTNYAWMFCEGVYLQRLIGNAFSPPKSLIPLYGVGWGFPLISSIIYGILRAVLADESCWAVSFENKEWIIYAPNLACLVMNLIFLCNILRILLTQIQTHPNEPNNFRRALRATFVLIPLFGVQLFLTIYRPPANTPSGLEYDRMSAFVMNSQGFFVALIFCFVNGEVHSHLKRTWKRRIMERSGTGSRKTNTLFSGNNTVTFRSETDIIEQKRSSTKAHKTDSCNSCDNEKFKGKEKIQMSLLNSGDNCSYDGCATRV